jgi:arylsulfatase A-like enzyme
MSARGTAFWRCDVGKRVAVGLAFAIATVACGSTRDAPRPSILLFVLDTVRADAVSAYGRVRDTTPATDALAAEGILYTQAYTPAPWTLPAHVTLFTGLAPSRHGVSIRRRRAAGRLIMLAERLRDAGYETVGVSANPWVTKGFNLAQGFERFFFVKGFILPKGGSMPARLTLDRALSVWLNGRKEERPFFLFVNVVDAHAPYTVREENHFLPPDVTATEAAAVPQAVEHYLCRAAPQQRELKVLQGLYLGDVKAADAKVATVLERLRTAGLARNLLTIVTSDHGEHFGEHGLVHHEFSVRDPLLHVPLLIHGLRGVAPTWIDEPVQLADIVPSVGRPLPTTRGISGLPRAIIAEFESVDVPGSERAKVIREMRSHRVQCKRSDKVFGDMHAVIRYPMKLVWFERYPAEMYDLRTDSQERQNLAAERSALVTQLTAELRRHLRDGRPAPEAAPGAPPSPEVQEQLRALGYIGDDEGDDEPDD